VHPEAKDVTLEGADSYKLFGVSHHFGGLGGGHYTSEAQDIDSEEWYSQNDSQFNKISEPKGSS
jgi:ubiquitin C-terminal hydrolase